MPDTAAASCAVTEPKLMKPEADKAALQKQKLRALVRRSGAERAGLPRQDGRKTKT